MPTENRASDPRSGRGRRWLRRAAVALLLLAGGVATLWIERERVILALVSMIIDRRMPVGPTRDVTWARGTDPEQHAPAKRPPNIVLIVADDLGWNDVSLNGGGLAGGTVPTPRIDSIAARGISFRNGYAGNATCAPSRAALMSGRYATRFGFEFTPTPPGMMRLAQMQDGADTIGARLRPTIAHETAAVADFNALGMPASEVTLAELLRARGYHTVHIGKWHLGQTNGMAPNDQGFDESLLMASGLYLPEDHPDAVSSRQDFDLIDRFLWAAMRFATSFNGGDAFAPPRYLTDYFTDEAVRAIEANRDRPFFLYLAHWAPHSPLQALREDYEALAHIQDHRLRVYAAMVRALDRGVGRVLDTLQANGIAENTLVLFTSDNGGAGYVGLPEVNRPYRGWKMTFFEGGIHVPFLAMWPGRIPAGTHFDAPVHHFDLYATAAAAGGASLPTDRTVDGVDLLPFVTGAATGVPHRALFWRSGASRSALVDGWKMNVSDPPGRRWLFDLTHDPDERHDLASTRPDKLAELTTALAAFDAEQAAPAWPSQASVAINVDKDLSRPDAADDEYIYWSN